MERERERELITQEKLNNVIDCVITINCTFIKKNQTNCTKVTN